MITPQEALRDPRYQRARSAGLDHETALAEIALQPRPVAPQPRPEPVARDVLAQRSYDANDHGMARQMAALLDPQRVAAAAARRAQLEAQIEAFDRESQALIEERQRRRQALYDELSAL